MNENTKIAELTVAEFRALMSDILDKRDAEKARVKHQVPGVRRYDGLDNPQNTNLVRNQNSPLFDSYIPRGISPYDKGTG